MKFKVDREISVGLTLTTLELGLITYAVQKVFSQEGESQNLRNLRDALKRLDVEIHGE